eukprot:jgi/Orpsp1_1/1188837/evm.model.d7180000067593.1
MTRHFPKINTCLCCCCMDFDTAIKVCTYTMIVINALCLLYSAASLITIVLYGGVIASLIFFLIGINKKNVTYIKQFIYVYLAKIILTLIGLVLLIVALFFYKDYADKVFGATQVQVNSDMDQQFQANAENMKAAATIAVGVLIGIYVIETLLDIYYYVCAGSYAEDIIEEIENVESTKGLENNAY